MPISNLFPNLVPCDSEFYFYPALNQRESICCQSGCHHVKCCVGRGAECPPARIRPTEPTSSLTVLLITFWDLKARGTVTVLLNLKWLEKEPGNTNINSI